MARKPPGVSLHAESTPTDAGWGHDQHMDAVIECRKCRFPMMNSDTQCPYCGAGPRGPMFETREQGVLAVGFVAFLAVAIAALVAAVMAP